MTRSGGSAKNRGRQSAADRLWTLWPIFWPIARGPETDPTAAAQMADSFIQVKKVQGVLLMMQIYYQDQSLLIRSMLESDIDAFSSGFRDQGWDKPREQFVRYFQEQELGTRLIFVAEYEGQTAGYVNLMPSATSGPFAGQNIPEIVDFNTLIRFQGKGIGNRLLDVAEAMAARTSPVVSLGVGLHAGYGTAQRMYVKRGYIPDGSAVWYRGQRLAPGAACLNDDDLVLYLSKDLTQS